MITLAAFLCNMIPHLLIIVLYGKDFFGEVPQWFSAMLGVLYFCYIVLDNVDGK